MQLDLLLLQEMKIFIIYDKKSWVQIKHFPSFQLYIQIKKQGCLLYFFSSFIHPDVKK